MIAAVLKPPTSKVPGEDERYQEVEDLVLGIHGYTHPVSMSEHDYMGKSVLATAVANLDIEMVAYLLKLGDENDQVEIDMNQPDYWGNTALHTVATAPPKPLAHVSISLRIGLTTVLRVKLQLIGHSREDGNMLMLS